MNLSLLLSRCLRLRRLSAIAFLLLAFAVPSRVVAVAADLSATRRAAVQWLETHQNRDGSWGAGPTAAVATAEGLLALAKSGRAAGAPAKRAAAWLLNQEFTGTDFEARAIRALEAAGIDMSARAQALNLLAISTSGWGPLSGDAVDSYDTGLAFGAIKSAGLTPTGDTAKVAGVFARRRSDGGWSGDDVPYDAGVSPSDRTVSAEIVRALAPCCIDWNTVGSVRYSARKFISTDTANGGAAVGAGTDTLEIASRLAAIHSLPIVPVETDTLLETALLDTTRLTNGVWSNTDALLNAIGLIALSTRPGGVPSACPGDADCDTFADSVDAFPYDESEHRDLDSDGIGDVADTDMDGDGFCDAAGLSGCTGVDLAIFIDDPTEHADSDNDGVGDNDEVDADGDTISNLDELERGTNPASKDTDGDGTFDQSDPCPVLAGATDVDQDGVCTPLDECDDTTDPRARSTTDIRNLDGDHLCDEADEDDDGDLFDDVIEVVAGTDPRDPNSLPVDVVATNPNGDFDRDGVKNADEVSLVLLHNTNPYLADTDGDGAIDGQEIYGSPPRDPNSAASQPVAVLAVTAAAGGGQATPFSPELVGSSTRLTATLGQPTPVATFDPPHAPSSGPTMIHLAGFQPQTFLGRDIDGDGLTGKDENLTRTASQKVDTDGDRFVDGASGLVSKQRYPDGRDLDGNNLVEGEGTLGTSPSDSESRIGRPGDVAPLGFPDGRLNTADMLVGTRLLSNPALLNSLAGDCRDITLEAADLDSSGAVGSGDVLKIMNAVTAQP